METNVDKANATVENFEQAITKEKVKLTKVQKNIMESLRESISKAVDGYVDVKHMATQDTGNPLSEKEQEIKIRRMSTQKFKHMRKLSTQPRVSISPTKRRENRDRFDSRIIGLKDDSEMESPEINQKSKNSQTPNKVTTRNSVEDMIQMEEKESSFKSVSSLDESSIGSPPIKSPTKLTLG